MHYILYSAIDTFIADVFKHVSSTIVYDTRTSAKLRKLGMDILKFIDIPIPLPSKPPSSAVLFCVDNYIKGMRNTVT